MFLDEITELSYDFQAKLLRAIQEGEIERVGSKKTIQLDLRIIAATNRDLKKAIEQGDFREDLFYRLNVIPIHMPPLRERIDDVPLLADFFLKKYNQRFGKKIKGFDEATLNALAVYHWPGNIRELKNMIERLVAVGEGETISLGDISMEYCMPFLGTIEKGPAKELLKKACMNFERNFILKTMEKVKWNRKETAKILDIPLSTLTYKINQLHIYETMKAKKSEKE